MAVGNVTSPFDEFLNHVKEVVRKYVFLATERDIYTHFTKEERITIEESLDDIYSLLHQVNPSFSSFLEWYTNSDQPDGCLKAHMGRKLKKNSHKISDLKLYFFQVSLYSDEVHLYYHFYEKNFQISKRLQLSS